ncbi:hypothetical protein Tco_1211680 [Tanacetum coccineum]
MGFVGKFVRDPNKTPDSSQRPPHNCSKCGNPVDGPYCRGCALLRKKLKEVWSTIYFEDENIQDFLNISESSNDKTNVVLPQEPFVFNHDPSESSSQSPPRIDHHCCYECGDSLDDIFCQRCTCKSCGNGAHYGYNCPPKVPIISNPEPCNNQTIDELPQTLPSFDPTCYSGDGSSFTYDSTPNFIGIISPNVFNPLPHPDGDIRFIENLMYDNSFSCPPDPPENSLMLNLKLYRFQSMFIRCVDDSYEDIDYVDALPPDSELVSLGEVKDFHPEDGEIEDDILREDNDNTFDNSLPESKTFCFNLEEKSSGSTTILFYYSLLDYEAFYLNDDHIEEKSSGSTTTHADFSQYGSFIFDLSINPFLPVDESAFIRGVVG